MQIKMQILPNGKKCKFDAVVTNFICFKIFGCPKWLDYRSIKSASCFHGESGKIC